VVGSTVITLFWFGLFQYLNTLPVTNGEMLFLRTRHPYLVAQAIAHVFRGSLSRGVMALLLAALLLALLWMVAGALGRVVVVRALVEYFRGKFRRDASEAGSSASGGSDVAGNISTGEVVALVRINFLHAMVVVAAILGMAGAAVLAGFASTHSDPRPGLAFLLFLPMAGLVCLAWWGLNWLLSLAGIFAVRDGEDAMGAVSAAVDFCREHTRGVFAVETWTGLAHTAALVGASTIVSVPLGLAPVLPGRLVVAFAVVVTLAYFALADWLYTARLAGYVCIAEMPQDLLMPPPPSPVISPPTLAAAIDRDELILSDVSNPAIE